MVPIIRPNNNCRIRMHGDMDIDMVAEVKTELEMVLVGQAHRTKQLQIPQKGT